MEITKQNWGTTPEGLTVDLYTLRNKAGNSIAVTTYGATWVSALMPDMQGKRTSVILGFDSLKAYLEDTCYLGSTVGRFANRIGGAGFEIDKKKYKVSDNISPHCLHGGLNGFNARVWAATTCTNGVIFSLVSPHNDQGFPGEVQIEVTYLFSEDNVVNILFKAHTTQPTPISLTNHAYFNLHGKGSVYEQKLQINSNYFLPMNDDCIVTGVKVPVDATPFDFRKGKPIGKDISAPHQQIELCRGYDESFILKDKVDGELTEIALAYDATSGRTLKMRTTLPTVHLYTGNFLSSTNEGHNGACYAPHEAFCLEAQFAPNSPNLSNFPSCILYPGESYEHQISFEFSTTATDPFNQ